MNSTIPVRFIKRWCAVARYVFIMAILGGSSNAWSTYNILVSNTADKASSLPLNGQSVTDNIYVFTGPDTNVKLVRFYLDDPQMKNPPLREDYVAPYDLMGGDPALPLDTSTLSLGTHTITARVSKLKQESGTYAEVVQASFTVTIPTQGDGATLPMSDDFNDGDAAGWTVITDSGITDAADWRVVEGEYRQVNNVSFTSAGAHHLGTYSYLDRSLKLTDYRVQLKAVPQSTLGRDIGIAFGYQDLNNYYRLYLSASDGGARVEKMVNGVSTLLAQNSRGFKAGIPLNITIDKKGPLIQIGINEDPQLFGIYDKSLLIGGIALYCRDSCAFDNVTLSEVPSDTSLVISKPEAYRVFAGSSIDVEAIVVNKPFGDVGVVFELGGLPCGESANESPTEPGKFKAHCTGNAYTNELTATLHVNGQPTFFSDTNLNIGLQGRSYIAIGDSVTFGWNDTFHADDDSKPEEWVISSMGYEAPLIGLLNESNLYPSNTVNNGYPGEGAASILASGRLDQDLTRNSQASHVLLLLGINDAAFGRPSGKGCTTNCEGTFKGDMQKVIGKILEAGKTPIVARIPPRSGEKGSYYTDPKSANRNLLVTNYNKVITSELGLTQEQIGPDFYNAFLTSKVNRLSLYSDFVHPNALGYRFMAQVWYNNIMGATGLPFILDSICVRSDGVACDNPMLYQQNLIEKGGRYYVDEDYLLTGDIPSALRGGVWVMPKNLDKTNAHTNYLTFTFSGTATVYVIYDDGNVHKPDWLMSSGFIDTGLLLKTSNPSAPSMRIYKRNFAGTATLGGNRLGNIEGDPENYIVVVKPK